MAVEIRSSTRASLFHDQKRLRVFASLVRRAMPSPRIWVSGQPMFCYRPLWGGYAFTRHRPGVEPSVRPLTKGGINREQGFIERYALEGATGGTSCPARLSGPTLDPDGRTRKLSLSCIVPYSAPSSDAWQNGLCWDVTMFLLPSGEYLDDGSLEKPSIFVLLPEAIRTTSGGGDRAQFWS